MKPKPITAYNPQLNGIIERVHLVLGDSLRTDEIDGAELEADHPWDSYLSAAAFAIRSTYHTTLKASPAQLVFGRDMFLPIEFQANWTALELQRQKEITKNNLRENASRKPHVYNIGDKVLVSKPGHIRRKLENPRDGPYEVTAVFSNGTIRIQRGSISERVNLRRVTPYFEYNGH